MKSKRLILNQDHQILIRKCGCKLHIFLTAEPYEELCPKCLTKKQKENENRNN